MSKLPVLTVKSKKQNSFNNMKSKIKSIATPTPKPKRPKSGKAALALAVKLLAEAAADNGEMF